MKQMTEKQAIALYDSNRWANWSDKQIVDLQLYQERLCVPFTRFHGAMEAVLGRPVWTHEFAFVDNLREEYEGKREKATMEDIVGPIPPEKLIPVLI